MSSALRRIFRREGTSKLEWTGSVSKTAPPTYVPDLVRSKIWNVEDLAHLDKVSRYDPLANFIVYGVADMIFDDGFTLIDHEGNEIATNKKIQHELKRLNAKKAWIQCLAVERWAGMAYEYTGKNKYIPESGEGGKIATIHCFTPQECTVFEYKENGDPKTMKIEINVGKGGTISQEVLFLPADDFIPWITRPIGRGYTGRSVLEAIWDMLIYIRYLFHSMTWYDMKIGHGLFAAFVHAGFDATTIAKWEAALEDVSSKRALVVNSGDVEKLEFIGPTSNATDFVEHIDMCIQALSAAVGIPKEILMGAAAGALSGSESNIKLGDEQERKIKGSIEEYLRETILRMGWDISDATFEWTERTSHTEEERGKIEQTHAQAQATKTPYLTIDELREIDGYPPLPDGRGDKLTSEMAAETQDFKGSIDVKGLEGEPTPEEKDQAQGNEEGSQI